jgi:membrane protease YdiL (CAAX protease family)
VLLLAELPARRGPIKEMTVSESSSGSRLAERAPSRTPRIAPSVPVAIGVFLAYVVVFIGLTSTSGIAYDHFFDSGANAFRAAVLPLIGGSLVLVVFVLWARWDWVFRDPERLPMTGFLRVTLGLFVLAIITHFAVVDWAQANGGVLIAIVTAGVLVGFAEETMFRGIVLRGLRTNLRPEAWAMLISSVWFGFFHLTNLANGSPAGAVLTQCVQASLLGVVLYLFRRVRGILLLGMIAHGVWDMSTFLHAKTGDTVAFTSLAVQVLVVLLALTATIILIRRDRKIAVTTTGVVTV